VGYMRRVASPGQDSGANVLDTSSRLDIWRGAARMWLDHPWLGVGPAHFDYRFREYRPETIQSQPDRAHNDYLNLLADWGIVGGVIVLAGIGIYIFWLKQTWPHVRREENDFGSGQSNRFAFFLGAVGGLVALAVHSAMDFNLHIPANALVGVTLLALVAGNARFATERLWFRPGRPLKLTLTAVLGGVVVYFTAQGWRRADEVRWLAAARAQVYFSPGRAAALEKAFAREPNNFETAHEIGECFRMQSLDGGDNFAALGRQAMGWYAHAIQLNPFDGYSLLGTGMCLDWLGRKQESGEFYRRAEACDPNGYFMVANIGWHYVQAGDYAAAQEYFNRSLRLEPNHNDIAQNYLEICGEKLAGMASGQPLFPAFQSILEKK